MKKQKIKLVFSIAFFVVFITIQLGAFTPFTTTETYISSQNVPHTVIIGRGWDGINNILDHKPFSVHVGSKSEATLRVQINLPLTIFQFILTAGLTALIYFAAISKKKVPASEPTEETELLKKQNIQLQQTIDKLISEKEELLHIKDLYEKSRAIRPSEENLHYPEIDINGLAFADEKTVKAAQRQYAEDMYQYVKRILRQRLF